jgi:hypothetical protein
MCFPMPRSNSEEEFPVQIFWHNRGSRCRAGMTLAAEGRPPKTSRIQRKEQTRTGDDDIPLDELHLGRPIG